LDFGAYLHFCSIGDCYVLFRFHICRHFDIEGYGHDQLEDNMTFLRRSTRQRKFLYGTFNQNVMLDVPSVESGEHDKSDVEEKETQQQEKEQSVVQPSADAEVTVDYTCSDVTQSLWIKNSKLTHSLAA